jgi:hypothetical protein
VVATWVFLGPLAAMRFQIRRAIVAWPCFTRECHRADDRLDHPRRRLRLGVRDDRRQAREKRLKIA